MVGALETSAPPKIASEICGRILSSIFCEFCVFCGKILSSKFCEFYVFCGRPFRQTFDEIVLFLSNFADFQKKTPYKFGKIKLFSLSLPISLEIVIKQLQYNTHYIY